MTIDFKLNLNTHIRHIKHLLKATRQLDALERIDEFYCALNLISTLLLQDICADWEIFQNTDVFGIHRHQVRSLPSNKGMVMVFNATFNNNIVAVSFTGGEPENQEKTKTCRNSRTNLIT